jgi:hypothetical protein
VTRFVLLAVIMMILHLIADFFAGMFICNTIPHLVSGLLGRPFPSPFANPPGKGDSSAIANFCWGSSNLIAGGALLVGFPLAAGFNWDLLVFAVGFFAIGAFTTTHFANVMKSRQS